MQISFEILFLLFIFFNFIEKVYRAKLIVVYFLRQG